MGDHWVLLKGTGTLMAPSVYTWDVSRLCVLLLAALCVWACLGLSGGRGSAHSPGNNCVERVKDSSLDDDDAQSSAAAP